MCFRVSPILKKNLAHGLIGTHYISLSFRGETPHICIIPAANVSLRFLGIFRKRKKSDYCIECFPFEKVFQREMKIRKISNRIFSTICKILSSVKDSNCGPFYCDGVHRKCINRIVISPSQRSKLKFKYSISIS